MQTLAPVTDKPPDEHAAPPYFALPRPRFTPYFCRQVDRLAAAEGLPPDPWPHAA